MNIKNYMIFTLSGLLLACSTGSEIPLENTVPPELSDKNKSSNTRFTETVRDDARKSTFNMHRELDLNDEQKRYVEKLNNQKADTLITTFWELQSDRGKWEAQVRSINVFIDSEYAKTLDSTQLMKFNADRPLIDEMIYEYDEIRLNLANSK